MSLMQNVVKVVDKVTNGLGMQAIVTHWVYQDDKGVGDPQFKYVKRRAVVTQKQQQVMSAGGDLVASHTVVTFVNGVVKVTPDNDRIVLSDGTGGPVLATESPEDKEGKLITKAYL